MAAAVVVLDAVVVSLAVVALDAVVVSLAVAALDAVVVSLADVDSAVEAAVTFTAVDSVVIGATVASTWVELDAGAAASVSATSSSLRARLSPTISS